MSKETSDVIPMTLAEFVADAQYHSSSADEKCSEQTHTTTTNQMMIEQNVWECLRGFGQQQHSVQSVAPLAAPLPAPFVATNASSSNDEIQDGKMIK
jgi:hypothetical protein